MRGFVFGEDDAPASRFETAVVMESWGPPAPKVLVIDDDPCLLPLMAEAFARRGFRTLSAENGEIGMRIFHEEAPDLVVTDIVMPEKDGIATIIELKRCPIPPKVIAISGGARISSRDCLKWARHLGADETMPKPFRMSALVAAARQLLAEQSRVLHSI